MYLKLLIFSALLCDAFCQFVLVDTSYWYQLPDGNANKSLNVTIKIASFRDSEITIECYNYDSLKYFELRLAESGELELEKDIHLKLIRCFSNTTNNENHNYRLSSWLNTLPYFSTEYHTGYPIAIELEDYAVVNSDVFFENCDFKKFDSVTFRNFGFNSTKFLKHLYCVNCAFQMNGRIDFNDFRHNITDMKWLQLNFNKLINFNRYNLKKLNMLNSLGISGFELDDYNAFNVPDLFENYVNMTYLILDKSKEKIKLHPHVFRGLKIIERIVLQGLQLDNIPNDLFKDLVELKTVYLSANNIKSVDPVIFLTNKNLSFASFEDNPFYTEPHDKLEAFPLGDETDDFFTMELGNFTAHTFDLLEQLIKNPKVREAVFESFLIDQFNIKDFIEMQLNRDSVIEITFRSGKPLLDFDFIKSHKNIIQSVSDLEDTRLNTLIHIQFVGDAICHDSAMLKYLFPHFLKHYNSRPGFYFEESRLFIEFEIPESCNHLEEHFEETFVENCPSNCMCKYNPLLDKVKINCNNKNLTEIPHIPYPGQFDKLHSMDLNCENNSIRVLSLHNQDNNVSRKLSTLHFKSNKIDTLQIDEADLLNNIWALNLCDNPILTTDENKIELKLASGSKTFSYYDCVTYDVYPQVVEYIEEYKSNELHEYFKGHDI